MDSYTRLFVHLIWATCSRSPILTSDVRRVLDPYLRVKAESLRCRVLALGGMPDHLHVLVRMHPATSVARLAQELKGASAYHINHLVRPADRLKWQGGYGAITCWERDASVVIRYIETQRARHASNAWMPSRALTATTVAHGSMLVDEWERSGEEDEPRRSAPSDPADMVL